jgi:hypothetical protein
MGENEVPSAVWAKLDLLISEQAQTNLMLKEVTGKQELLAQVAEFQAERLREHREQYTKQREEDLRSLRAADIENAVGRGELDKRIDILEKWRFWLIGIAVACGFIVNVTLSALKLVVH